MRLMGREELIDDPRFATGAARVKHEAEVDAIVTEWTRRHTKEEAMALISGVGVPAGAVFDTMELQQDPSFEERGIMQVMEHPIRLDECVSICEFGPGARVPSPNARHHVKRETSREGGSP